jgi:hypothetical protein
VSPEDVERLDHGLYVILWDDGGYSLVAVGTGSHFNGPGGLETHGRWFAATNWTSGPSYDWSHVSGVVPVLTNSPGVTDDDLDVAIDAWMVGDSEAVGRLGHKSPAGLVRLAERLHRRGAVDEARAIYQEVSCVTPGIDTLVRVFGIARELAKHWTDQDGVNAALIDQLVRAVTPAATEEPT